MKYVVMENSWEYNDEYYTKEEGGHPIRIWNTEKEALEEKKKLEQEKIRSMENGKWGNQLVLYLDEDESYEYNNGKGELKLEDHDFNFFSVIEVPEGNA